MKQFSGTRGSDQQGHLNITVSRAQAPYLVAVAGLGLLSAIAIFASIRGEYPLYDLRVYQWGAEQFLHGSDVYGGQEPLTGAKFTYPPFSALFFVPLVVGGAGTALLWSAISIASLCRTAWLLAAATGIRPLLPAAAAFVGISALLEPVTTTVLWGQINLLLLWLVTEDRIGRVPRAIRGAPTGLAAALKITPMLFVLDLLTTRRWRAGGKAVSVVIITIALTAVINWESIKQYFTGTLFSTSRIAQDDSVGDPGDQSINGLLWRLFGTGGNAIVWILLAVAIAVAALVASRTYLQLDRPLAQLAVIGIAMLLITPVSWTHHWVWALPALALLADRAVVHRRRVAQVLLLLAVVILGVRLNLWLPYPEENLPWLPAQLLSNAYVLLGIALFLDLLLDAYRSSHSKSTSPHKLTGTNRRSG